MVASLDHAAIARAVEWPEDGPDCTLMCECGVKRRDQVWRVRGPGRLIAVSRNPCPGCGQHGPLEDAKVRPDHPAGDIFNPPR